MTTARKDLWTPMTYGWMDSEEYRLMKPGPLKLWMTMTSWAHRSGKAGLLGAMLQDNMIGVSISYKELADHTGLSEKSVRRHIEALEDAKWIFEGRTNPRRRCPVWMIGQFFTIGDDKKMRCWYFAHQAIPGTLIFVDRSVREVANWTATKIGSTWRFETKYLPVCEQDAQHVLDTAPFIVESGPEKVHVQ